MTVTVSSAWIKFALGWLAVFFFRLLPFRVPNVEPMMAALMPFSKRFGAIGGFLFAFLGIVLYDAVTAGIGNWTWLTAFSYGAVGVAAHYYFASREATRGNFVAFGVMATLAYDAVTMLGGPLYFNQPLATALAGQIPFTVLHLLGTVAFAAILSPALYRWVVMNEKLVLSFGAARSEAR